MKILATKRSWGRPAQDSSKSEAPSVENGGYADLVDERGNHADILKFASKADIVVCCLAMNNETVRLLFLSAWSGHLVLSDDLCILPSLYLKICC